MTSLANLGNLAESGGQGANGNMRRRLTRTETRILAESSRNWRSRRTCGKRMREITVSQSFFEEVS